MVSAGGPGDSTVTARSSSGEAVQVVVVVCTAMASLNQALLWVFYFNAVGQMRLLLGADEHHLRGFDTAFHTGINRVHSPGTNTSGLPQNFRSPIRGALTKPTLMRWARCASCWGLMSTHLRGFETAFHTRINRVHSPGTNTSGLPQNFRSPIRGALGTQAATCVSLRPRFASALSACARNIIEVVVKLT